MERINNAPKVSCGIHVVKLVPSLLPDLINTLVRTGNNMAEVAKISVAESALARIVDFQRVLCFKLKHLNYQPLVAYSKCIREWQHNCVGLM